MDFPNTEKESDILNELDWVRVRTELRELDVEPFIDRIVRKTKQNPVVPIGVLATVSALSYGIYNFYIGNSRMSQQMMRARVGAQTFTLFAIAVGVSFATKQ